MQQQKLSSVSQQKLEGSQHLFYLVIDDKFLILFASKDWLLQYLCGIYESASDFWCSQQFRGKFLGKAPPCAYVLNSPRLWTIGMQK